VVGSVRGGWWWFDFLCDVEEEMSDEQDDGGPAFPFVETDLVCGHRFDPGMSLRDYFAAKAMQAMLSIENVHLNYGESELAKWSYQQADAMLEERNRK
jgi:hypothetical protein